MKTNPIPSRVGKVVMQMLVWALMVEASNAQCPPTPTAVDGTGCINDQVTLSVEHDPMTTPITYVWSGYGGTTIVGDNHFTTPPITSNKQYLVTVYNSQCTLTAIQVKAFVINSNVDAGQSPGDFCSLDPDFNLSSQGSPAGGTWTGPGVYFDGSDYLFNPDDATVNQDGDNTLTYEVDGGCIQSDDVIFHVDAQPQITMPDELLICGSDMNDNVDLTTLGASPAGGTWSGPGVSGNYFDPDGAQTGQGVYTIIYTVTNGACTAQDDFQITVLEFLDPVPGQACLGDQITLSSAFPFAVPAGELPSYQWYDPSRTIMPGETAFEFHVTPSSTEGYWVQAIFPTSGCTTIISEVMATVLPPPTVSAGTYPNQCTSDPEVTLLGSPSGGTWSGTGVVSGKFYPGNAGLGSYTLTYTYTDANGCVGSDNTVINVDQAITVTMPDELLICGSDMNDDVDLTTLGASPAGGTWSGPGVSGNYFDPDGAQTGQGVYTIIYTVTNGACTAQDDFQITVLEFLDPVPGQACLGDQITLSSAFPFTVPAGELPSYQWYDPSRTIMPGETAFEFHVTPSSTEGYWVQAIFPTSGCTTLIAEVLATVLSPPVVSAGSYADQCISDTEVTLVGSPSGGTWTGTGVTGNQFDPGSAGTGSHVVTYTYMDANGCFASDNTTISVFDPPSVEAGPELIICGDAVGNTYDLAASGESPAGGIWSGAGVEFVGGVYQFDPLDAGYGYHQLTYSYSIGGCTVEDTKDIYVLGPLDISNSGPICQGTTITLDASLPFPMALQNPQWQWYESDGVTPIAGATSSTYQPQLLESKNFYVQFTDNGCDSDLTLVEAVVEIPAAPSNPTEAASFGSGTLTLSVDNNQSSYVWYTSESGSGFLAGETSSSITSSFTETTTYWVASVNANGCESPIRTSVTAYILDLPVITSLRAGNTLSYFGDDIELTTGTSYDTYEWKLDGATVGGALNHIAENPGDYTVTVGKLGIFATSPPVTISATYQKLYNFTKTEEVQIAGAQSETDVDNLSLDEVFIQEAWSDGLGRPVLNVWHDAVPHKNLVQLYRYDGSGQLSKRFLPYPDSEDVTANTGDLVTRQASYYQSPPVDVASTAYPFLETVFEPSPLNRVIEQGAPGQNWQPGSNTVGFSYQLNTDDDEVFHWQEADPASEVPVISDGFYAEETLYKTILDDENGNKVIYFADKVGRQILKRVESGPDQWLSTYYVYDNIGNVRFILPPQLFHDENLETNPQAGEINLENILQPRTVNQYNGHSYRITSGNSLSLGSGFQFSASTSNSFNASFGPPVLSTVFIDQQMYEYRYDSRQRLIAKKIPGADWEYFVYDQLDRPILAQDGSLRPENKWRFAKFDLQNRTVQTGIYTDNTNTTREDLQAVLDGLDYDGSDYFYEERLASSTHGYSNQCFPTTNAAILTVTYYDDYDFNFDGSPDFAYLDSELTGQNPAQVLNKGRITGSKRIILGTANWLEQALFYDEYGRLVQIVGNNQLYLAGEDASTHIYDFTGKPLKSKIRQEHGPGADIWLINRYEYDFAGRVEELWHQVEGQGNELLLGAYEYNELGQLVEKNLNQVDEDFTQSVDYRYNERGWLLSINGSDLGVGGLNDDIDDVFGMSFVYDEVEPGLGNSAYFNGNISALKWQARNAHVDNHSIRERSYAFTYDGSDRLTNANYAARSSTGWDTEVGAFDVNNLIYDHNGNILGLERYKLDSDEGAADMIDDLSYGYEGNRIVEVNDAGTSEAFADGSLTGNEYLYDDDGNLIRDENKGLTISYNDLNKTDRVDFDDGRYIQYMYDGTGSKLGATVYDGSNTSNTDYIAGFVYHNGSLAFVPTSEGRLVADGVGGYDYEYFMTDQLGNTRVAFQEGDTDIFTATMENENAMVEEAVFSNVAETRQLDVNNNHTPGGNESSRLNGYQDRIVGPAISLMVQAGDVVDLEVFAKYNTSTNGNTDVVGVVVEAVTGSYGILNSGETQTLYSAFNDAITGAAAASPINDDVPTAYLNYLIFDREDYSLMQYGFIPMPDSSYGSYSTLSVSVPIQQEGFLYTYVANESSLDIDVFFDDFKVTHQKKVKVIQENHYYPFGLTMGGVTTNTLDPTDPNLNLFNAGSELQTESGLYDTYFRQYDPALGRFNAVDPLADQFAGVTPYNYGFNDPVYWNDPLGDEPENDGDDDENPYFYTPHDDGRGIWSWLSRFFRGPDNLRLPVPDEELPNSGNPWNRVAAETGVYDRLGLNDWGKNDGYNFPLGGRTASSRTDFRGGDSGVHTKLPDWRVIPISPHWLGRAEGELGVAETPWDGNTVRVLQYLYSTDTGVPGEDATHWCAAFCNWILRMSDVPTLKRAQAAALNWTAYGITLTQPAVGSLAIMKRGTSGGHIGFVAGTLQDGRIVLLGGNQNDMVNYMAFPREKIIGFVHPYIYQPNYNLPIMYLPD